MKIVVDMNLSPDWAEFFIRAGLEPRPTQLATRFPYHATCNGGDLGSTRWVKARVLPSLVTVMS
jgi:hypothetical protein